MMRSNRMLSFLLAVVMVVGMLPVTALAEGFARTTVWQDDLFTDVKQEDWFYENVKGLYELGLMIGYGNGLFQPETSISMAETLTVAARIHATAATGEEDFVQEEPWYQVYADYALEADLIDEEIKDYDRQATRLEFARILARTMSAEDLPPINEVPDGSIPDLKEDEAVYMLYRAGVLMGDDEAGTFRPDADIKRSEVAAIVTRMILPELRHGAQTPDTEPEETTTPAETTEPEATKPAETEPAETQPVVTEPAETQPVVTEPAETQPVVTEPAETQPVVTEPAETQPVVTEPAETQPVVTEPAETQPVVTEPVETQPETGVNVSADIELDETGAVKTEVALEGTDAKAVVPAGVAAQEGAQTLTLSITEMESTTGDIELDGSETLSSYDVHIEGVAADNQVPILVELGMALEPGFNLGNLTLYHVEAGATNPMTQVMTLAEVDEHNEFFYDPATGVLTMAMASFSEIALVSEEAKWEGKFDYTWYDASKTELTIANADQLAAFGAIVGGMAKDKDGEAIEQDSFTGKTVKLIADVNLGDAEKENNPNLIFYPIGYYNSEGTYERRTNATITSGLRNFAGTFDGNGHTISNFYQNTWEMKGDNNYYDATLQYYRDGMGLFGRVYGGTIKNLTVKNFSSDGEYTTTGVIAAYADGATFENIAIFNCNPRVYNTGNGGIVGCVGWYAKEANLKTTFKNITVDNSNKISALWGSYDVACGGIVGQYYPTSGQTSADTPKNGGVHFENCHVAAQMDVYNDVCANYQYYAYRYTGMLIGSVRENVTIDGHTYPKMDGITAEGCTVHFGTWNDYYYCEIIDNTTASYTHDYQMSRLTEIKAIDGTAITYLDGTTGTVPASGRANYVIVDYTKGHGTENATCYHFKDGKVWLHEDGGKEVVNGVEVLKEDKQHLYLEFNNLVTGYGWGVTTKGVGDLDGVTILDREVANSVEKFAKADTARDSYTTETTVTIGELFKAAEIDDEKLSIKSDKVQVTVSPVGEVSTVSGIYTANTTDWTQGTLTFSGTGAATITITDYYFCTPTTIEVTITEKQNAEKFETKFTGDFLYRVGNQNAVKLDSLFKAKDGATIGNVSVTVEAINGTAASGTYTSNATWTNGTIQFSGTGVVKVTITDNDHCIPTVLMLEVVDAVNATAVASATANSVVLLNNVSGSFSINNGHTVYGNGFTVTLPTTTQSNYSSGYVGYVTMNDGNLDNVKIVGPNYPVMNIYREQAKDSSDTTKANYFYNSIYINGGNCTISNSYISGSRTAVCIRGGNNVMITDTTISGGAVANVEIAGASSVTLRDLTTVQPSTNTVQGMGVYVTSGVCKVYIEETLTQRNWINEEQWNKLVGNYANFFPKFFSDNQYVEYQKTIDGKTYVNLAMIFACNWDTKNLDTSKQTNKLDYKAKDGIALQGYTGGVYSVTGSNPTADDLKEPDYEAGGFAPVIPTFSFDNTSNNDADDANDANDTYCVYNESTGTLKIGVSGDSKTIDLSKVTVSKNGAVLAHTAYLNGNQISGNSITIKVADGAKQTLTFKATSSDVGYDKDGKPIDGSIEYTWTVTVEIAVLSYPAPVWNMGGDYQFDTKNCVYAYYQTSDGYGEAVPIYEGIKVNYYNKSGTLVNLDLSGTTTHPTGSNNSNADAFAYTLSDGSTLTMKFSSGWKSGATTHQFTTYNNKVYIYPQSLDNNNYIRAKVENQDFDVKISYTFTDPNGQSISQTMQWYNAKANNKQVSTVQWKDFDSVNGKKPECVTAGTLFTMADGTQKPVEDLVIGDMIMVFNHISGQYEAAPLIFNTHADDAEEQNYDVLHLQFSDGKELEIVAAHGLFDMTLMQYVYIDYDNYQDYIGHEFYALNSDGTGGENVTLTDAFIQNELTRIFCPVTYFHMNSFANGLLNTPNIPGGITGLVNYFEYDPDLKYNEEAMQRDIEKYGLYTYEDFSEYISEAAYNSSPAVHLKVAVGKGMITYEQILAVIEYLLAGSLIE